MIQLQNLAGLLRILAALAITVLPVMLAARFVGAGRPGFLFSAIAVLLGGIAASLVFDLVADPLLGAVLAFLAMCSVYAWILQVSVSNAIGLAVIAFLLQLVFLVALASLPRHVMRIDLPSRQHFPRHSP
jgi:hypothetical protein